MNLFHSIKFRLFSVFAVITILPGVIITLVSYQAYSTLLDKQVSLVSSNMIRTSVERVNNILNEIGRVSQTFVYQQTSSTISVAQELRKYDRYVEDLNNFDFYTSYNEFKFLCTNLMYNHSYINGVYLFASGGNSFSYGKGMELVSDYVPFHEEWYESTLEKEGKLYIGDIGSKDFIINSLPSIPFSRALYDVDTHKFLGMLYLDCSLDIFNDLDRDIIPDSTNIFLINEAGKIIYCNNHSQIGQALPQSMFGEVRNSRQGSFKSQNGEILNVYQSFTENNWKLIAGVSTKNLKKEFEVTRMTMVYIALICSITFILLSIFLSFLLTRPISDLSLLMKKNESHQLVTTGKYLNRNDEVGVLYTQYNRMIEKINTYIRESYQNRLIMMDSQMKALEAQIHPHFLYNTLESISSIARVEGIKSIVLVSKALGDMFRYAIKTKSELVTLEEELAHIRNYLTIQKTRFQDKITCEFHIQDELLQVRILKLILEPIVENAIYHGLEKKDGPGILQISGWLEGSDLFIEIADNGIGMSSEQLEDLQLLLCQEPSFKELGKRETRGIGIKNVHSRIELYYGKGYGLSIKSDRSQGTCICVHVPLR